MAFMPTPPFFLFVAAPLATTSPHLTKLSKLTLLHFFHWQMVAMVTILTPLGHWSITNRNRPLYKWSSQGPPFASALVMDPLADFSRTRPSHPYKRVGFPGPLLTFWQKFLLITSRSKTPLSDMSQVASSSDTHLFSFYSSTCWPGDLSLIISLTTKLASHHSGESPAIVSQAPECLQALKW